MGQQTDERIKAPEAPGGLRHWISEWRNTHAFVMTMMTAAAIGEVVQRH